MALYAIALRSSVLRRVSLIEARRRLDGRLFKDPLHSSLTHPRTPTFDNKLSAGAGFAVGGFFVV
jgi:hypothetical protein